MKRRLLPLTIAGLLAFGAVSMASCDKKISTPISINIDGVSVKLMNETDLKAEWHVGDADREVVLKGVKDGQEIDINTLALIADGRLKIVSSDTAVITPIGLKLHAASAGTATIEITLGSGAPISVEITTLPPLVPPDIKKMTLAEVMAQDDTSGTYTYLTSGTVSKWKGDAADAGDYGNMFLKDGEAEMLSYGVSANNRLSWDSGTQLYTFKSDNTFKTDPRVKDIKIGDKLDVICIRSDFSGEKQIKSVVRAINGVPVYNYENTTDEVPETEMNTTYLYKVTGKITRWAKGEDGGDYGNFYIKTDGATGDDLYIYGATATDDTISMLDSGAWKFNNPKDFKTNATTKALQIGDTVTVIGVRADYNGTVELQGQIITE